MLLRGFGTAGQSGWLMLLLVACVARASEITFELPDNAKQCFYEEIVQGTKCTLEFQVGEDPPLFPSENRATALTQMESACVSIHEALKSVIDYQTHFRLREAQGRSRAEDLNTRVAYWSIGEAVILLVVSIGQVFLLKSFFSDKRTTTTRVGS
ncbi:transmembrane emp24 domain-containing protein 7 isoform X2 [Mycteria americana]|uniref:transmembrane emp24 domain-containing protein 7 isoform X2 n=1 Tax=Mycteria americana TaxID=33587 RepID=UPI003F582CB0